MVRTWVSGAIFQEQYACGSPTSLIKPAYRIFPPVEVNLEYQNCLPQGSSDLIGANLWLGSSARGVKISKFEALSNLFTKSKPMLCPDKVVNLHAFPAEAREPEMPTIDLSDLQLCSPEDDSESLSSEAESLAEGIVDPEFASENGFWNDVGTILFRSKESGTLMLSQILDAPVEEESQGRDESRPDDRNNPPKPGEAPETQASSDSLLPWDN